MRADKKRNLQKVAEELVKNPHATELEIVEATGLGKGTAHRAKKELEKNGEKDGTIQIIVKDAKKRIEKVGKIFDAYIQDIYDKYYEQDGTRKKGVHMPKDDAKLIKDYVRDDLQRVTVLGGSITDEGGGLKEIRGILDDIID